MLPDRLTLYAYTKQKGERIEVTNTPLVCAERRLLNTMLRSAVCNGVRKQNMVSWIHRKYKDITIERNTSLGPGTSFPCVFCRRSLEQLDMRVRCTLDNETQCVRISESDVESKYTTGQKLNLQPRKPCVIQSLNFTRRAYKELKYTL